jgi:hypothetical protein
MESMVIPLFLIMFWIPLSTADPPRAPADTWAAYKAGDLDRLPALHLAVARHPGDHPRGGLEGGQERCRVQVTDVHGRRCDEERYSRVYRRTDLVQPRRKEQFAEYDPWYDQGYNGKPGRLTMSPEYLGELTPWWSYERDAKPYSSLGFTEASRGANIFPIQHLPDPAFVVALTRP